MSTNAATKAKETVTTGREATAVALDRTSTLIRDTAKQAAGLVERGGTKAADVLEESAVRVDPHRRGVRGYVTGHPRRFFVAGALFAAVVAFLFVRGRLGAGDDLDI